MDIKVVDVWQPIQFSAAWEACKTSRLDSILPSWINKRESLKDDPESYERFMERLKRQHAIETGIVERLYDLKEGITETFIKEGFVESYLQHGDSNIPSGQLMAYLKDNFDAMDFIFDVIKNNRPITKGFIKELHQLLTAHQDTAEGRDQFGNRLQIPLLKGEFKQRENNPTRADGVLFKYCPPVHVESEMDRLIAILEDLEAKKIKPVIIASWLHHAFAQIHPFQDGNGRAARLLSSLVLIKHGLFPFTVKRNEKKTYIDALELADGGEPQDLVNFFVVTQKKNIEAALNLAVSSNSLLDVTEILSHKLEQRKEGLADKMRAITENRKAVFEFCEVVLNDLSVLLKERLNGNAKLSIESCPPGGKKEYYFAHQIAAYAGQFNYFFNRALPKAWFRFGIFLKPKNKYQLIITLHHFGYDSSTLAIGAILEFDESKSTTTDESLTTTLPLSIEPYTLSLDVTPEMIETSFEDIKAHIHHLVTLALAQIANEIS